MGHRLLVVDSDRRFLQDHKVALESAFEAEFRDNTDGALQRLESGEFAAILLCVEVSENRGYSLCSAIRRNPLLGELKVALISAKATEEEYARHQSLKGRADLYLHKPLRPNALISALSQLAPPRPLDPDQPLGDAGGMDLGDEWLESLRGELELEPVRRETHPLPLQPVSTLLGLGPLLPPLPPPAPERMVQAAREAGRVELLEARVHDLESKLVATSDLLDRKTQDLEEALQQEQEARDLLREKSALTMDLMESNQLLQAQLAESREETERFSRAERAATARGLELGAEAAGGLAARQQLEAEVAASLAVRQELEAEVAASLATQQELAAAAATRLAAQQELEADLAASLAVRQQLEADLAELRRQAAAQQEISDCQQMELMAGIDDRDGHLARMETILAGLRDQLLALEQDKAAVDGELQASQQRLQGVTQRLEGLAMETREILELAGRELIQQ